VPATWALLPPGDAALTGRVKKLGPSWLVREKKGRKLFSLGLWAPAEAISATRAALRVEREDPAYQRKLAAGRRRRALEQAAYVESFEAAVFAFLGFAPANAGLAGALARAITDLAAPVGSNTVARTKRIPLERRAEAATIAWLRHQTTTYDSMQVPRVKGARRELRRQLAARSRELLAAYRRGPAVGSGRCPLRRGLDAHRQSLAAQADHDDDCGSTEEEDDAL